MTKIVASNGLEVRCANEYADDWEFVLSTTKTYSVEYDIASVNYYSLYFSSISEYEEKSFIFYANGKPVAVWPISIKGIGEDVEVGSNGSEILPPLMIPSIAEKISKKLINSIFLFLSELKQTRTPLTLNIIC